jgi:hypothetical protein
MSKARDRELSQDVERELAALADGSFPKERRDAALARLHGSPQLREELEAQRHALQLLAAAEVTAPAALHERIGTMAAAATQTPSSSGLAGAWRRRMRSRLRLPRLGVAFVAATGLAGVVGIALTLSGTGREISRPGSRPLSAAAATTLALGPATLPPPGERAGNREELAAAVGGVSFPYWEERFGWRSSGARTDTLGGRVVTTVFYSNAAGQRIGYAIVGGPAPAAGGGSVVRRWGVSYRLGSRDGANTIVWHRDGHLCVMAARGVSPRTLLSLASWGSDGRRTA